MKTLASKI